MRVRPTSTLAVAAAGCGDDSGPKAPEGVQQSVFERQLKDAQQVSVADFPAVGGKTLQELADTAKAGPQAALATSVLVPGENRLAFGVLDAENNSVYGKTAVYVAPTPASKAEGPYPAPADSLLTDGRFRSRQAASEDSPLASIYAAEVPLQRPGRYAVLVVTKTPAGLLGASDRHPPAAGADEHCPGVYCVRNPVELTTHLVA